MENIEQTIHETLLKVASEKSLGVETIENSQKLIADIGFKSIDLARIIAMLEFKLDADPFSELVPITSIKTVGDLCKAYLLCFSENQGSTNEEEISQAKNRAEARLKASSSKRASLRKSARKN